MPSSRTEPIDYRKFPVLYVDDEEANLRTFELAFRRDFSVFKAQSGSEALAVLASQPIAVVLSDHRMPGMTGTELLGRAREIAPRAVRLLVTAYGDAATLAQAINDGCIYRYVPKPWDPEEMRVVVRQAIALHALELEKDNLITELTTLNSVSQAIASHLDVNPLVNCLQQTIVGDLGYDGASVMLATAKSDALTWYSSFPVLDDRIAQVQAISRRGSPKLFAELEGGRPCLLQGESGSEGGPELRALLSDVAADEMVVMPLHGRRGLLGALAVDNRRGGDSFAVNDRQLLQGLAAQAATAMDNAQLVGELRNDAARTSGADALAIAGALGESMLREVRKPIAAAAADGGPEIVAATIADAATALEVFAEILGEQRPVRCDVGQLVEAARQGARGCAVEHEANVRVEPSNSAKVDALPGRLLQLLLHLLEISISRAQAGAVVISVSGSDDAVVVEMLPVPGEAAAVDEEQGSDAEPNPLRLSACEALAREVGGGVEIGLESSAAVCRLSLRVAP